MERKRNLLKELRGDLDWYNLISVSQLLCNLVCTVSWTFSFHISNFDPGVGTILTVFLRIAYNTQVLQLQNLGYLCYYRGKKERHRQTVDREWRPYNFLYGICQSIYDFLRLFITRLLFLRDRDGRGNPCNS